jgi:transglutaminase-like putative cysteine protease
MIYRVRHTTTYNYVEPVLVAHHMAHLMPRSFAAQSCRRTALRITPAPASLDDTGQDYFGNPIAFFTLQDPHRKLTVEALSRVEVKPRDLPSPGETPAWEAVAAMLAHESGPGMQESVEFCFDSPFIATSEELADFARPSFPPDQPILAGLLDLNHRIYRDFTYDPKATTLATPLEQVLKEKRGVCQDFAHLSIACLRSLGLAARYVSGYLMTRPPPGKVKLKGSDASHAWLSAFVPGFGWIDFDPTNDCIPGVEHVTTAWGRDYQDVSPLSGVVLGGGDHSLKVAVDVEPLEV